MLTIRIDGEKITFSEEDLWALVEAVDTPYEITRLEAWLEKYLLPQDPDLFDELTAETGRMLDEAWNS